MSESVRPDFVAAIRALNDVLQDTDLAKQVFSDANAIDRQNTAHHALARIEFAKQVATISLNAQDSAKEFGMQTLKWLFLLNAGAIGLILAYIAGKSPDSKILIDSIVLPICYFATGCVLVPIAGAAGYFNFMSGGQSLPSPSSLHQFTDPSSKEWPKPRSQLSSESDSDFAARINRRLDLTQKAAVILAIMSAVLFFVGVLTLAQRFSHHFS